MTRFSNNYKQLLPLLKQSYLQIMVKYFKKKQFDLMNPTIIHSQVQRFKYCDSMLEIS